MMAKQERQAGMPDISVREFNLNGDPLNRSVTMLEAAGTLITRRQYTINWGHTYGKNTEKLCSSLPHFEEPRLSVLLVNKLHGPRALN